jgi:limonene-1,2-epoxide hydrolase
MSDTSTQPIEIVRRFLKAMEPLDYDTALALVSPTCVYINPPPIGEVTGPEGIRAVLDPSFRQHLKMSSESSGNLPLTAKCSWSGSTAIASMING